MDLNGFLMGRDRFNRLAGFQLEVAHEAIKPGQETLGLEVAWIPGQDLLRERAGALERLLCLGKATGMGLTLAKHPVKQGSRVLRVNVFRMERRQALID